MKFKINLCSSTAAAVTVELLPFPLSEKLMEDEGFLQNFYKNPKVEKVFAELIPWLDLQDALDLPQ